MANYIIQLLGGVDKFLSALIVFMVMNYIAEMLLVIVGEKKRSNVFLLKNLFKKAAIFILVIVSNIVGTIIESSYAAEPEQPDTPDKDSTGEAESPQAGQAWRPWWLIVVGTLVIIMGIGVFFVVRKKEEDSGQV